MPNPYPCGQNPLTPLNIAAFQAEQCHLNTRIDQLIFLFVECFFFLCAWNRALFLLDIKKRKLLQMYVFVFQGFMGISFEFDMTVNSRNRFRAGKAWAHLHRCNYLFVQ